MVGSAEERLATPWHRSRASASPSQLNLLTAFAAASSAPSRDRRSTALLAAFLPVLAGQSGNTGRQALAVTPRE
jgi:magnesium transporter